MFKMIVLVLSACAAFIWCGATSAFDNTGSVNISVTVNPGHELQLAKIQNENIFLCYDDNDLAMSQLYSVAASRFESLKWQAADILKSDHLCRDNMKLMVTRQKIYQNHILVSPE